MSQTVLITGASGGLGLEFARIFSREGYDLLIVARREGILYKLKSELESQYHNHVEVFACDLSKADAAYEVFQKLLRRKRKIQGYLLPHCVPDQQQPVLKKKVLLYYGASTNRMNIGARILPRSISRKYAGKING